MSHNANDIREGYCGACHDWTGAIAQLRNSPINTGPIYHYDKQSNAVTFARWAWLMEPKYSGDSSYYRVAEDTVDLYWVSTVWTGLDMSLSRASKPIIFETMTFLDGTAEDMGMARYGTEAEALAGHEAIVAEIRVLAERAADQERINDGN